MNLLSEKCERVAASCHTEAFQSARGRIDCNCCGTLNAEYDKIGSVHTATTEVVREARCSLSKRKIEEDRTVRLASYIPQADRCCRSDRQDGLMHPKGCNCLSEIC
jgi:hypothetical protein